MTAPPTIPGQQVARDLQIGDRIVYWRSGDFGLPATQHPGVYLRTTPKGLCQIQLDSGYRCRYVRRTSIVRAAQ